MARVKTSVAFDSVEGTMGGFVVARGKGGPVVRRKPVYRRPTSPGQAAQAARMAAASALWRGLSDAQALAWGAWAGRIVKRGYGAGVAYHPTGYNAFMELTLRALQASPGLTPPSLPPTRRFVGDSAVVTASPVLGAVRFSAGGPNAPGVGVELLVQRLESARRKPGKQYKSMAFVRFVAGGLSADVPVAPGTYACAARTLDPVTGQALGMVPLGLVTVA